MPHIKHIEIYADYVATGLPLPPSVENLAAGVVELKKLEVDYEYPARNVTERDISRTLKEATATPFAAVASFMAMLQTAGGAQQIPQHLIDDLDASKGGLDICDVDVRAALVFMKTAYPDQETSIDKLLALNIEKRPKYPDMKTGWIQNAIWKSNPNYGVNS